MTSNEYKGNGNHDWESVQADDPSLVDRENGALGMTHTDRLRVPGGWLYRTTTVTSPDASSFIQNMVLVPLYMYEDR